MAEIGKLYRYNRPPSAKNGLRVEVIDETKGQRGQPLYWVRVVISGWEFYAYEDELNGEPAPSV